MEAARRTVAFYWKFGTGAHYSQARRIMASEEVLRRLRDLWQSCADFGIYDVDALAASIDDPDVAQDTVRHLIDDEFVARALRFSCAISGAFQMYANASCMTETPTTRDVASMAHGFSSSGARLVSAEVQAAVRVADFG